MREIRPIFGLEFEVSFSALDERSQRLGTGRVMQRFMSVAGERFAHLPARESSGIFLGNGGRLYLDCGKPEITTPEVMTPTDACRYARAGEQILLDICQGVMAEMSQVKQIILNRCNVSYSGSCNAWACHESYGHRGYPNLADDFIPHAVSRIIYTGAGGFDSRSQGIAFLISPRVAHLHCAVSDNTQRNRGIYNTKNEPLNRGGYNRLHVICGENESSIRAQWLKMATTAVVIALIQAGLAPGDGVKLKDPVRAMRAFARDVTLQATARTVSGRSVTALDIQRQLLEKAKQLDVSGPLAEWLPDCCRLWEETLDRLEQGPTAVQRMLDWAIKLDLFQKYVQRRGLEWSRLERWDRVLKALGTVSVLEEEVYPLRRLTNVERAARLRRMRGDLDPRSTLDWDELDLVLQVRQELFELDTRFGEIGDRGIFDALDAQGRLEHHVAGVEDIEQAKTEPPSGGRAQLRGEAIRALADQQKPGACEWSAVWDYSGFRMLDLADPFASQESWTSLASDSGSGTERQMSIRRAFEQAVALYDRGEYESAYRMLRIVVEWMGVAGSDTPTDCSRFFAWIQAHRGYQDGASWLSSTYRTGPQSLPEICDYLLVYRFEGLQPGSAYHYWCDQALRCLARTPNAEPRDVVAVRCSYAYALLCKDRPEEAWNAYHDGMQPDWMQVIHARFRARILTEKADVLRRLGRLEEAADKLDHARQMQIDGHFNGDFADFNLTQRAKIAAQQLQYVTAREMLSRALHTQRNAANVMGEMRSLLLLARMSDHVEPGDTAMTVAQIRERVDQICDMRPALSACCLVSKIRQRWDRWLAGEMLPGHGDRYWGL